MGGAQEPAGTPEPIEKGFATLATLRFVFILPLFASKTVTYS
jgi:hypothetical protein